MRTAICLYVRNEERDIGEWICYHSLLGIESFVIYDNLSDDGTLEVLDRLRRVFDIKIIEWPRTTKFSQLEAYDDCLRNFYQTFDWIAFIDSDEFIAPILDGNIKYFLDRHDDANGVVLNWAIFGSSGHVSTPPGLITGEFKKRAFDGAPVNKHTKVIIRPRAAIRVTNPHLIAVEGRMVHPDGSLFESKRLGATDALPGFDVCRLNHYFVRSQEQWAAKMRRGYREGYRPTEHFAAHDLNDVEDRWAANHSIAVREVLQSIEVLPIRSRYTVGRTASSDDEKQSASWLSITSDIKDVMYHAPQASLDPENKLFDPDWYLAAYPDVRASGLDPFLHFCRSGFAEGRRPCSRALIIAYVRSTRLTNGT